MKVALFNTIYLRLFLLCALILQGASLAGVSYPSHADPSAFVDTELNDPTQHAEQPCHQVEQTQFMADTDDQHCDKQCQCCAIGSVAVISFSHEGKATSAVNKHHFYHSLYQSTVSPSVFRPPILYS